MDRPVRILVADDEPAMLSLNSTFLRQKGFDVTEASDGEQAWSLALRGDFDLLLLDVHMPGKSGWEVCKLVKQTPATAGTAVMMLTGLGETLNDLNSPLFSADAWLDKPFDFGELERKLRETLAKFGKDAPKIADIGSPRRKIASSSKKSMTNGAPAKVHAKPSAAKKQAASSPAKKTSAKPSAAKKPAAKAKKAASTKAGASAKPKSAAKPAAKKAPKKKAAAKR
jgi:DNA-binding response OmpR family regulator